MFDWISKNWEKAKTCNRCREKLALLEKFLASQLLKQNQSNKFVLLGAPGSGKTTLLSFFAVMLAQDDPEKLGWDSGRDCLPILIEIRDFARLSDINILDYARQFAESNYVRETAARRLF